jgi:acetolactate synthase-1/3 small subunit
MDNLANKEERLEQRRVLSLTIDNEAGALGRVVGLFSGRGYNINSLTVAEIDHEKKLSRITITTTAPENTISHIITLLERLVPVHKVKDLTVSGPHIEKGLILVKVAAKSNNRQEILHFADSFGASQVSANEKSFVFQLTDIPEKLDEFVVAIKSYGIIEIARTGITAISTDSDAF